MREIENKIVILGAGMAGFGAAYHLHSEGIKSIIYEKNSYYGGHAASFQHNGFIFDDGPHISFTQKKHIQNLFLESVNQEINSIQARTNNYWRGYWIKHPAQCNLYGLPEDLVADILVDFIHAQNNESGEVKNYKDWLFSKYGKTFSETFPMQYGKKYHTTAAENMSTDWIGKRMYQPDLREVIYGALSPKTPNVHYVDHFRYPLKGGFVSFLGKFVNLANIKLKHEVVKIDPKMRNLYFSNGKVQSYGNLISSLPLPETIKMITGVPDEVLDASQKLACTTCVIVTLGINRECISDDHWIYFYDQDYFFTRLSFPSLQSPNNSPPGCSSIQAEIYFSSKYHPLDRSANDCVIPVINDLKRCGILKQNDKIIFTDARIIPYANVIFDLDRHSSLSIVHGHLDELGIIYCGRYGEWGYHWTDDSFISGEKAAQKVLDLI